MKSEPLKVIVHKKTFPKRKVTLTIEEWPDKVVMKYAFSKVGDHGDTSLIEAWLFPILMAYDNDPRPSVIDNPMTGERTTCWGDSKSFVARIEIPPKDRN